MNAADISQFLLQHVQLDLQILKNVFARSMDDTNIIIHLFFKHVASLSRTGKVLVILDFVYVLTNFWWFLIDRQTIFFEWICPCFGLFHNPKKWASGVRCKDTYHTSITLILIFCFIKNSQPHEKVLPKFARKSLGLSCSCDMHFFLIKNSPNRIFHFFFFQNH